MKITIDLDARTQHALSEISIALDRHMPEIALAVLHTFFTTHTLTELQSSVFINAALKDPT